MNNVAIINQENKNQVLNELSIKQFEELNIQIYGTYEEPLFKAKDIGELLEIKNIKDSIKHFTNKQKDVAVLTDSIGRRQESIMLTEQGLYKVLMKSRKPIAEKFQDWVCQVVEDIRKTGKYESQQFIENNAKSNTLLENYIDKSIAYIGIVKEIKNGEETYTIVKYGITRCVKDTLTRHRNMYGEQFYFTYMIECGYKDVLERKIQTHTDLVSRHVKEYDGKKHNELLRLDNNFTINNLIELMKTLKESMESKYSIELELSKELTKQKELDTKQKELENVKFIEETKQKEMDINLELKKMEFQLEMRRLELQVQVHIPKPVVRWAEPPQDIITEYFNNCTVFSANNLDTIKMTELYRKFVEWIKVQHPNTGYPSNREFTPKFKKLQIGTYKSSINNLNGTSGIINRKFKN
jgi:prophage antirepressor-like protein